MKCILLTVLLMVHNSFGSMDLQGYFDLTKCCEVEKTAIQTEYIEKMVKLAEECKEELGN